jgi:error-prone DNA polymerase
VIVRQRPGSAKGFLFLTLEDETGLANAILTPKQVARFRVPLHASALLEIAGPVQHVDGVVHVKLRQLAPLALQAEDGAAAHAAADVPEGRSYR